MVADGRRDPATRAARRRGGNGAAAWSASRHAAWFAVGASCAVLIVLAFAASRLAGPPANPGDAFPGLPNGGLLTAQPPASQTQGRRPPSTGGNGGGTSEPGYPDRGGTGPGQDGAPGDAGPPSYSAAPGDGRRTGAPGPSVTYLPPDEPPAADAQALVETTVLFYDRLAQDVDAAWQLVGTHVQAHGLESFRKQWAGIASAHVQEVVVDAGAGTVVATVALSGTDGSAKVRQYRLEYRKGDPRVVQDIAPLGGNGQKPAK